MADTASLERIDSFPYRHRVHEVMGRPLATARPGTTIAEAARNMGRGNVSSLVVVDEAGRAAGIVTERDVLDVVADRRGEAADVPLGSVMSSPVATIRSDSFVYVALGRMERLGVRHLVAVDEGGVAVGVVTARGLLKLRASSALMIGDEVTQASSAAEMAAARARLPALARDLLAEGIGGLGVAAISSSILRDVTARAAELAAGAMAREHWGAAPAPFCILLLGSGGRRESLFGPDQDNALIHDGGKDDDAWFAELGRRMADTLDAAGIPYCRGGVMARNREWRHTPDGWAELIDRWIREAGGEVLLNVHIFVDFRPAHGDFRLAADLRDRLAEQAARSPRFLHAMAQAGATIQAPLGLFGRFVTHDGLLDIKTSGLLPLTAAVRTLALKHRITATGTSDRLAALAADGNMNDEEARSFRDSHELMVRLLVERQAAAMTSGEPPSNRIDPARLRPAERRQLKQAFKNINALGWVMRNALSTV